MLDGLAGAAPRDGHPHPAHDRDRGHRPRGPGGHVLRRLPAHRLRPSRPGRPRPGRGRRRAGSARWGAPGASRRRDLPARAALHQLAADLRAVFGALGREGRRRPPRDQRARTPGRRQGARREEAARRSAEAQPVAGDPRGTRRLLDDRPRGGRERRGCSPVRCSPAIARPARSRSGSRCHPCEAAQSGVARAFLVAGSIALVAALCRRGARRGARSTRPVRRMAGGRGGGRPGELSTRMAAGGAVETRRLAESFNHMLDRLEEAFADNAPSSPTRRTSCEPR